MAVAKVAAMNGGATKAGCMLALLLLAGVAAGQNGPGTVVRTAPATPGTAAAPAATPMALALPTEEKAPAVPPKISYVGGQLKIDASGSTLADVLTQVAALTGVKIDIPAGASSERMPVVELGPGPARQILASLLSDSNFDYLIQASETDSERIQSVLIMPREKKGAASAAEVMARASRGPGAAPPAPPEEPVADSSVPPQPPAPPDANSLNSSPAAAPPTPVQPDQSGQFPLLQPDTTNPAKPGALAPPATLNQDSINQQLQQMYQQRLQMTQQDHYTGTQPLPPIPGVK